VTASRLLLADDDPRLVHIVAMYLGMEGFEVVTALDGEQALRHLMSETFDAVILDVMMPGADGISVCRAMRQQPHNRHTPVLIFTALSSVSDAERARLAGATHMITKPFSLPGLGAVLKASVGRRELAAT